MVKSNLLGSLEQKIMNILWESETPLKPSEVLLRLENKVAYTTVMTVLSRLYDKGLLKRQKGGKAYVYTFQKSKQKFARSRLDKLYHQVLDNYGEFAISQFVDTLKKNENDLNALEEYLKNTHEA
ncbi:hypothetical protein COS81_00550 [candidate division WWE3 bacterium CG06_land_8_20_14_3_00_42_16]|uniref:CopY family transcriptional regulator n=2 Tax=Katanobacteria TaxID=422282 RepID=A0A2M7APH1_UNCKA|nr:MAG: hypothetical protein COS81_00550 [candidate division WWE3 bacterium CG06_land_8_20_14_3_00_42_16]PJC68129.1 MAG: hypothetical protein CO015_05105 [candidate division WWE3 bacterium CG_4_8_14_3_um_filter_42_11]